MACRARPSSFSWVSLRKSPKLPPINGPLTSTRLQFWHSVLQKWQIYLSLVCWTVTMGSWLECGADCVLPKNPLSNKLISQLGSKMYIKLWGLWTIFVKSALIVSIITIHDASPDECWCQKNRKVYFFTGVLWILMNTDVKSNDKVDFFFFTGMHFSVAVASVQQHVGHIKVGIRYWYAFLLRKALKTDVVLY